MRHNNCLGEFSYEKLKQIKNGTLNVVTGDYFETNGYKCYIEILHWLYDIIESDLFNQSYPINHTDFLNPSANTKIVRLVGYIPNILYLTCDSNNYQHNKESELDELIKQFFYRKDDYYE